MFPKGPRDSQNWRILTLRELRSATCLVQTSLLAFHDTGVAGQHAGLLQGGAVGVTVDGVQSAGNAETDGTGLTGGAAAVNEDDRVELAFELCLLYTSPSPRDRG